MVLKFFIFVLLVATTLADEVNYEACDLTEEQAAQCEVSKVSISSCSKVKRSCQLRRDSDVTVEFEFTPKFSAEKLKNAVFWMSNVGELPWADLDPEGCKFTTCPIEADKSQNFAYSLHIGKKTPEGTFRVKWLVKSEEDDKKFCCFKTTIKIKK